jgi:predicted permease
VAAFCNLSGAVSVYPEDAPYRSTAESPMRNVRLAFRTLFRTPFVTAVAVLSLALGIGANAAIFSLTDQVLLRSLSVPEPERLVNLTAPGPNPGSQSCNDSGGCDEIFSYRMFRDLERSQNVLSGLAAYRIVGANLAVRDEPFTGDAVLVSGSYFRTLELSPALGRLLGPDDDATLGAAFSVVLTYAFWHARFGASPSVIGQTITVNGQLMSIVGVAPRGFEGTTFGTHPLLFVPLSMSGKLSGYGRYDDRRVYWLYLFGRLKPGVTLAQAKSALNGIYRPILNDVEAPLQKAMSAPTMAKFRSKEIGVNSGYRGQSQMHREARTPLAMLFGVTAVVLLIACANIANLLLARAAGRAKEMGVRLALGAGRRHLVAQLLTESVLLALMGGVASLAVAEVTLRLLATLLPADTSTIMQFSIQPPVIAFAALLAVGTGLAFGLFPALHSTRSGLIDSIRSNAGQITGHRGAARFRSALVTAQIALATGLLICSGLFLKSLVNVTHVDLGLHVDDVVTFTMSPRRSGFDSTHTMLLFQQVEEELARLPGVTGVTSSQVPLLAGSNWGTDVYVEGFKTGPDIDNNSRYNEVGPGYFSTLGIPVLQGREFTASDFKGAPRVAVVNQTFAKKFHIERNPVHTFMSFQSADSLNIEIVGLVQDAKYSEVKQPVPPLFFSPWRQEGANMLSFYVRTAVPPEQQLRAIPALLKRIAPTVPIEELKTMPQQIRDNVFLDRLISILSAVFAALATLLAAVGLYGVLAYTVQQRTREIGVRMALGADAGKVRALVVRQVGAMAVLGGVAGIGLALALGKLLQSLLYGLEAQDPAVFVMALAALGAVAFGASYVPVLRASRVDPVEALRYE